MAGSGEIKLPDGRLVSVDDASDQEFELAASRLDGKSRVHAEEAARLGGLRAQRPWLTRGVAGIGGASFLADVGHEVPTALLPTFLTTTLGASASALGLIEGIADGCAGVARFAGGALADDPESRRRQCSWRLHGNRGLLVLDRCNDRRLAGRDSPGRRLVRARPTRPGTERAARRRRPEARLREGVRVRADDGQPWRDRRSATCEPSSSRLSVFAPQCSSALSPGSLQRSRSSTRSVRPDKPPNKHGNRSGPALRPVLKGDLGTLFFGIGAFEIGNVAATLLILRAVQLLTPSHGSTGATQIALWLYIGYNAAARRSEHPGRTPRRPPRQPRSC